LPNGCRQELLEILSDGDSIAIYLRLTEGKTISAEVLALKDLVTRYHSELLELRTQLLDVEEG